MYKIDQLTPIQCPETGRNTLRPDENGLQKHIKYRCRLAINGGYGQITNNNGYINRHLPMETGLPNCELLVCNGKVKYGTVSKIRLCQLRDYIGSKYECEQVLGRADNIHNVKYNLHNCTQKEQECMLNSQMILRTIWK